MRVFHGPVNHASVMSARVRALSQAGVEAVGFCPERRDHVDYRGIKVFHESRNRLVNSIRLCFFLLRMNLAMFGADVIHWYGHERKPRMGFQFRLCRLFGKAMFVEWLGTDVRRTAIEAKDNPFYRELPEDIQRRHGNDQKAERAQTYMRKHGLIPLVAPGMVQYLNAAEPYHIVDQTIATHELSPRYPDPEAARVRIVHAPSKKAIKGSAYIEDALDQLVKGGEPIEYRVITGVDRERALEEIASCDIFIDQLVLGDRGMASLEAMALGKPVVCYLKPSILEAYPEDCPIVNASRLDIVEVLRLLIRDGERRNRLGQEGRRFVEKYHSFEVTAHALTRAYRSELDKKRKTDKRGVEVIK